MTTERDHGAWTTEEAWIETRKPLDQTSGLPAECYTDADFFALESERVFARSWVCIGTVDELEGRPGPSDDGPDRRAILARTVAGRSVIVTTDADDRSRGFHNACRHRGTALVDCDGSIGSTIRCPYHRWAYALDGRLIATPRFDDVPLADFDRADYPLHTVRIEAWGPLLFACLDDDVPPLADWLGDLPARLDGYQLGRWAVRDRATFTIDANWKLISENFQEYYHLPFVHPELAKVSPVADHYRFQGPGMYCGQCTTPVSGEDRDEWTAMPPADDLSPSDAASGRFIALFPNLLLSVLPNHAFAMILQPVAADRTIETGVWLIPPNACPTDDEFAATRDFWIEVNSEDIAIVERGQRGLGHAHYTPGRLSPRFEEPLHRFHNLVADRMTGIARIPGGDGGDHLDRHGSGVNPLPWEP
ncbi:MAG: aromatic ring-hydroxylating dioxygenase subunit alpha [Acidimicrobiia bacterium]|nr:aromatic ring-hydroxylating dioxygenase subunit alpha [Acidimicrobiia bacterium]